MTETPDAGHLTWRTRLSAAALGVILLLAGLVSVASAHDDPDGNHLDPARNVPLPCEYLSTPGTPPRSARDIVHLANVCGIVGTDIEFQSRADAQGETHDYAFVGTMGAGFRIFDVTDPAHPFQAGGYIDSGWQNDIQVRGDIAVSTFDGVAGEDSSASTCLKTRYPDAGGQGVDVFHLHFNAQTATFEVSLATCVANPPGGAHNSTLSPTGEWLAISNPSSDWVVDVIDLRPVDLGGEPRHIYRLIDESRKSFSGRCPADAGFECVVMTRADGSSASGLWRPHDVSFSADGGTMYAAAINSTFIVDVGRVLSGTARTVAVIPNVREGESAGSSESISISHQSDVTADGKMLVISDERGGGVGNTSCNTSAGEEIIGALHFYALGEIAGVPQSAGASPESPKKIGIYVNPQPLVGPDALQPVLDLLPRTERGCTSHVFRLGGNGSSSPGESQVGFDGVSTLSNRQLTLGWYGAGTWFVDFSSAPSNTDGTAEDAQTTWGNTLGWNIQPGADTWSAKEYKGHIYTGDMIRGFDVFKFADCEGLGCVNPLPTNTPGKASGGGQITGEPAEMTILRGTAAGGKASFGFGVEFVAGAVAPTGDLSFTDHGLKKSVTSTGIDSFVVAGNTATWTGKATVNGVPNVSYYAEVQDFGEPGTADTFRIVLGDGYAASGVLLKGNIQVQEGAGGVVNSYTLGGSRHLL